MRVLCSIGVVGGNLRCLWLPSYVIWACWFDDGYESFLSVRPRGEKRPVGGGVRKCKVRGFFHPSSRRSFRIAGRGGKSCANSLRDMSRSQRVKGSY